ncbi:MAG: DUF4199 domain-containing protein [Gammaproteobacteria bacterium]
MLPENKHFLKTAVSFGFPAGLTVMSIMIAGFILTAGKGPGSSQVTGTVLMLLAFSVTFFGIGLHRKNVPEPPAGFIRSLLLGTLIALCAGVAYTLVWELYLYLTNYVFIEQYIESLIETKRARFSAPELEAELVKVNNVRLFYLNPIHRIPNTFSEIFPPGLIVAVLCCIYYQIVDYSRRDL